MKLNSKNPGGRPRSFDRDAVLDAAVRVFWKKGYEGASLDDLTSAMGINRPSLYATFGNKRGLFLDALARYRSIQGKSQSAPLREEDDIRAAVAGYYREVIRTVAPPDGPCGCLIASVACEVAERDDEVREIIATGLRATEEYLDRRLADAVNGLGASPTVNGSLIVSAGMSLAQRARLGASPDALRSLAESYVDHFFPREPSET